MFGRHRSRDLIFVLNVFPYIPLSEDVPLRKQQWPYCEWWELGTGPMMSYQHRNHPSWHFCKMFFFYFRSRLPESSDQFNSTLIPHRSEKRAKKKRGGGGRGGKEKRRCWGTGFQSALPGDLKQIKEGGEKKKKENHGMLWADNILVFVLTF